MLPSLRRVHLAVLLWTMFLALTAVLPLRADTVSYSVDVSRTALGSGASSNGNAAVNLPKFDLGLGELLAVQLKLEGTLSADFTIDNRGARVNATLKTSGSVALQESTTNLVSVSPTAEQTVSLPPRRQTVTTLNAMATGMTADMSDADTLALFSGMGTLALNLHGQATSTITSTTEFDYTSISNFQSAKVTVTYTYGARRAAQVAVANALGKIRGVADLQATLTESGSDLALAGETLTFKVNGVTVGTGITDADGTASFAYSVPDALGSGEHALTVEFGPTGLYDAATGTGTLTVEKANTALVVLPKRGIFGKFVLLTATLTGADLPVEGREVAFQFNGVEIGTAMTNAEGEANLDYIIPSDAPIGNQMLTASFAGDLSFDAANGDSTLEVLQAVSQVIVSVARGRVGQLIQMSARLRRDGALVVPGKTLTFKVKGTVVGTAETDANGLAKLTWTIPGDYIAGDFSLTVEFAGDERYTGTSGTGTLTVFKSSTQVLVRTVRSRIAQHTDLYAILRRTDTVVLAGRTVNFKFDGVSVGTAVTDETGLAKLRYTVPIEPGAGDRTFTVEFDGDDGHTASMGTGTLVALKCPTMFRMYSAVTVSGSRVTIQAKLRRVDLQPQGGRTISLFVRGVKIGSGVTDAFGIFSIEYLPTRLDEQDVNVEIRAEFEGDSAFEPSSGTATLTVNPPN